MSRLERWSRKKRGEEVDEQPLEGVASAAVEELPRESAPISGGAEEQAAPSELSAQQAVDETPAPGSLDHTLPDPDALPPGSDFSVFMASGVSAALRRRALKRLWATGNYNVRDGLDDYDADYRQQLKPMASELASKLRRWANEAEEHVATNENVVDETATEEEKTGVEERSAALNAREDEEHLAQNGGLDDQSDRVSAPSGSIHEKQ